MNCANCLNLLRAVFEVCSLKDQQALAIAETNFDLERKIFGKLARAENSSKELSGEEGLDGQPCVELMQEIEEVVATTLSLRPQFTSTMAGLPATAALLS